MASPSSSVAAVSGSFRHSSGGTTNTHSMAAAPITYRDQGWLASSTRFSSPQQSPAEPSITEISTAAARRGAKGTSSRSIGNGVGLFRSTGWLGLHTSV